MVKNSNFIIIQNKKPVEEVQFWEEKKIKISPLSQDARKKVVNKSGSNFRSEKEVCGPCLNGDINSCRCSKEELERQKVLIELQREKEKLEAERKQRAEGGSGWWWQQSEGESWEKRQKRARMEAAWRKWEAENRRYLQEQEAKFPWNRNENWRQGVCKPSSNIDDY